MEWITDRSGSMMDLPHWYLAWGPWWAVLFHRDWTFSFGVHVEPRKRAMGKAPFWYGPYADFHFPMLCLSVGRNPVYVGSLETQRAYAKGKFAADPVRSREV